jgi:ABC-type transporter MlaC component
MKLSFTILISTVVIGLFYSTFAPAQQHPMVDKFADKVVAKYQGTSCEDLKAEKAKPKAPPSEQEQKVIQFLKSNPDMRKEFIDKIAAPIANKMFDCGLIP